MSFHYIYYVLRGETSNIVLCIFIPKLGEESHFDYCFSDGLKPLTSYSWTMMVHNWWKRVGTFGCFRNNSWEKFQLRLYYVYIMFFPYKNFRRKKRKGESLRNVRNVSSFWWMMGTNEVFLGRFWMTWSTYGNGIQTQNEVGSMILLMEEILHHLGCITL